MEHLPPKEGLPPRLAARVRATLMRFTGPAYANHVIWGLVIVAFSLRIASFFILPISPEEGDQGWYLAVARNLLGHGDVSTATEDPFTFTRELGRPWGLPLLLTPFVALGTHYRLPLMIALSASSALAVFFTARLARQLVPRSTIVAIVSAGLVTFSPYEIQLARYVMTEPLLIPSFLAFVSLCIDAARRPTLRTWLGIAFLGALMMHLRLDGALLVLGPPIMVIAHGTAAGTIVRFGQLKPWVATLLAIATLCIPFSMYATAKTGRFVILADTRQVGPDNGLEHWMAVTIMPEPLWWKYHYDYPRGRVSADLLPDSLFDTDEQAAAAKRMLQAAHQGPIPESDAFFDTLATQRRKRLSTWTVLPTYRTFALWFDFGPNKLHGRPRFEAVSFKPAMYLLEAWVTAYAVLFALGFAATLAAALNSRNVAVIVAGSILVRTLGELFAGIWAGSPLAEVRYQTPVQPLALLLVTVLAARIWGLVNPNRRARPADQVIIENRTPGRSYPPEVFGSQ